MPTRYVLAIGCLAAAAACLYPPHHDATGSYFHEAGFRPVWEPSRLGDRLPIDYGQLAVELAAVGLATAGLRHLADRRDGPQRLQ